MGLLVRFGVTGCVFRTFLGHTPLQEVKSRIGMAPSSLGIRGKTLIVYDATMLMSDGLSWATGERREVNSTVHTRHRLPITDHLSHG
jgi:hypothetical protein